MNQFTKSYGTSQYPPTEFLHQRLDTELPQSYSFSIPVPLPYCYRESLKDTSLGLRPSSVITFIKTVADHL